MSPSLSSFAALSLAAFALGGCARAAPPCMAAAPQPITAPSTTAIVVFAREGTVCDRGGYVRVIEQNGDYLGDATPDARFAVALPPGEHVFIGWDPGREINSALYGDVNRSGTMKATLEAGRVYYVSIRTARGATIRVCPVHPDVELVPLTAKNGRGEEIPPLLASTEPQLPKPECSDAMLRSDRRELDRHIRKGLAQWAIYGEETRRARTLEAADGAREAP